MFKSDLVTVIWKRLNSNQPNNPPNFQPGDDSILLWCVQQNLLPQRLAIIWFTQKVAQQYKQKHPPPWPSWNSNRSRHIHSIYSSSVVAAKTLYKIKQSFLFTPATSQGSSVTGIKIFLHLYPYIMHTLFAELAHFQGTIKEAYAYSSRSINK